MEDQQLQQTWEEGKSIKTGRCVCVRMCVCVSVQVNVHLCLRSFVLSYETKVLKP